MLSDRFWRNPHERLRSKGNSARLLLVSSLLVTVSFCIVCASILWDIRRTGSDLAVQASANLLATIEADIARNLELYDLSLQAVVDGLREPEINQVSKNIRQLVLFDRAATAKHLGSIRVVNADGIVVIDSRTLDRSPDDVSHRAYFQFHKQNADSGLHISIPIQMPDGEYYMPVSRRLFGANGSFAGVAVGTLHLGYFQELFSKVALSSGSAIGLMHEGGSASPLPNGAIDQARERSEPGRSVIGVAQAVHERAPISQRRHFFRKGEVAEAMFYVVSGRFGLTESGIAIPPAQIVGELGLLAPDHRRTQSLECTEDGEVLTISYDQVKQLYFQNPKFGFYLMCLTSAAATRKSSTPTSRTTSEVFHTPIC
jgi:hypothetical protein